MQIVKVLSLASVLSLMAGDHFKSFLNVAILGIFGKLCFSPFLVTKTQMCLTGSITSENKGGVGGSDPLQKKSIGNLLFIFDGFPS